jgi:hypothetical protein
MSPDEQEAKSFRYIAPRIMVLSSGVIAIIPMMGDGEITYHDPNAYDHPYAAYAALVEAIPTLKQLDEQYVELQSRRPKLVPQVERATLDDLA